MASPTVDLAGTAGSGSTSSLNLNPTTGHANEILVIVSSVCASVGGTHITVSSIVTTGLTWAKLGVFSVSNIVGQFANEDLYVEVWTAEAATAANYPTTVNYSGTADAARATMFAIAGTFDDTSWWDDNIPTYISGVQTNDSPTITYSTTQPDDLLFFYAVNDDTLGQSTPAGWTGVEGPTGTLGGGNRALMTATYKKSVSTVQTSQTVRAAPGSAGIGGAGVLFAFTADAKTQPLQTFVVTICG